MYCDSCHISMHVKKLIKSGKFLCSHLNIEDGGNKQHFFGTLCFIILRKVKTQLKCKKRLVQYMEKVL